MKSNGREHDSKKGQPHAPVWDCQPEGTVACSLRGIGVRGSPRPSAIVGAWGAPATGQGAAISARGEGNERYLWQHNSRQRLGTIK